MIRKTMLLVSVAAFTVIASNLDAQNRQPTLDVQQLMSAADFRAAGLHKLSDEEVARLNEWLQQFALTLMSGTSAFGTPDVIESQIEGEFEGWDGETIFKLLNGQIWQQASYAYHYHYAYMPEVLIYKTSGGYKMKVEGVDETIYVRRIR
jgi:hypothetical protein